MAYATLEDVRDRAPQLRFGQGGLALDRAERIVASVNNQVDSIVQGLGWIVPVTGTQSVEILKDVVISGAIAQLLKAMFYGIKSPEEVGANDAWREFTAKLKALSDPDNPLTLPDATPAGDNATKVSAEILWNFSELDEPTAVTRSQVF